MYRTSRTTGSVSNVQDQQTAQPYYLKIAAQYEHSRHFEEAERCYIKAGAAAQVSIPLLQQIRMLR